MVTALLLSALLLQKPTYVQSIVVGGWLFRSAKSPYSEQYSGKLIWNEDQFEMDLEQVPTDKNKFGTFTLIFRRERGELYVRDNPDFIWAGENKVGLFVIGWNSGDPHDFLSVQMKTGGKYNTMGFASPRFDQISDAADAEFDLTKRAKLFTQADQVTIDEVADVPLVYNVQPYLISQKVKDLDYNLGGIMPHWRTRIEH